VDQSRERKRWREEGERAEMLWREDDMLWSIPSAEGGRVANTELHTLEVSYKVIGEQRKEEMEGGLRCCRGRTR